jgi:tungstate transport system permease protein
MSALLEGMRQALALLLSGDAGVIDITLRTLQVSGVATLVSLLLGIPLGTWLALALFRGRSLLLGLVNTGMGLPPVVVGLFVALMLWRSGPLGDLRLIYSPSAMIIAQTIIAFPIVAGISASAVQQLDPRLRQQLLGLGASPSQLVMALWWQTRLPLLSAAMAGFGGAISEVGASMMVGGNIAGQTRVMTTAIALETSKGDFSQAMALGSLLLALSLLVTLGATWLQQRGRLAP